MAKDDRIVVRMSAELRDWVHAQAEAREMDDAGYVRMVLAEARSGVAATRLKAGTPLIVEQPVHRDVLSVGSGIQAIRDQNVSLYPVEPEQPEAPSIDVDAMVASTIAEAEEAGLTQAQIEDAQGDMPTAGVRPLMRRPIPFSRGTQHARLEQMFGGQ